MSTALAKPQPKNDIRALLQSDTVREQIVLALPKHMSPDRMMRIALTAINKNPALLECTQQSILLALMQCSQYGVEPDGRNAHLIAYNNKKPDGTWVKECQFQWDYKGLVAQIRKSPDVADIYADTICENDVYEVSRGLHRDLIHKVDISKPRGPIIAAYSVCLFRDGTSSFELMTVDDIESIRMRSKSTDRQTGKSTGPWATDYSEMAKKTVIKRHSKLLPLPTEIAEKLEDEEFERIPQAHGLEIKSARIETPESTRPSLPDPSASSSPRAATPAPAAPAAQEPPATNTTPAQDPAPAPAKKRQPAAGKKSDPAPAPAPAAGEKVIEGQFTTTDENPKRAEIKRRLAEAGFTVDMFEAAMHAPDTQLFAESETLETVEDHSLQTVLDYWDDVLAGIRATATK